MIRQKKFMALFLSLVLVLGFSTSSLASNDGKININTASVEELATLDRVGESYAKRIVEYRDANGPFEKPEDIMKVKGIGQKTFEANQDRITVGE